MDRVGCGAKGGTDDVPTPACMGSSNRNGDLGRGSGEERSVTRKEDIERDRRERKAELRKELMARRSGLAADVRAAASEGIGSRVLGLPEVSRARSAFVFISHGSEVATHALIDTLLARGVRLTVPRVVDRTRMVAAPFPGWDELAAGTLGIPAPVGVEPDPVPPEVVLTPGLAFTPAGGRVGYGRGYYDRWFLENPDPPRIALGFECQVVDALPLLDRDVPVDVIVTEDRVIRTGRRRLRGA